MPSGPRTEAKVDVGRRLSLARRRAGLTQRQLADLLGLGVNSVQAWEQGRADPYRRMADLERVLGIDPDWLFTGSPAEVDEDAAMSSTGEGFHLPAARGPTANADGPSELRLALRQLEDRVDMLEGRLRELEERN